MSDMLSGAELEAYASEMREKESRGDYEAVDSHGHIGVYQSAASDQKVWLEHQSSTPSYSDNLANFLKSMLSPLDDMARKIGRTGLSVAPVGVRNLDPRKLPKESPQVGSDAGGFYAVHGHVAPARGSNYSTSRDWSSEEAAQVRRSVQLERTSGLAFNASAAADQSPELKSIRCVSDVADELGHAQLLAIGGHRYTARQESTVGSIAPIGRVAGRRGTVPNQMSMPARLEARAVEFGSKTKNNLDEAAATVEQDITQAPAFATAEVSRFGPAIEAFFLRQARLPPSGATGFDPKITPLWAGLKLPV